MDKTELAMRSIGLLVGVLGMVSFPILVCMKFGWAETAAICGSGIGFMLCRNLACAAFTGVNGNPDTD